MHAITFVIFLYWAVMWIVSLKGLRSWQPLSRADNEKRRDKDRPLVSVIIAAKEEERSVYDTVKHLLNQSYERLEIIVVNDRSQDRTAEQLEAIRRWSGERKEIKKPLKIVHLTSLPAGWMGKNHALYQGYLQAKGRYLLFTDADVVFSEHTVRDALAWMLEHRLDHLTMLPAFFSPSGIADGFIRYFIFSFHLFIRPWTANEPGKRKKGVGIGAFNFIRRDVYEKIGTHASFALHPIDDLELGRRVKAHGFRQRVVGALAYLQVEWYADIHAAIKGLEKNLFAGLRFRFLLLLTGMVGQGLFLFSPFVWIWLNEGSPLWLDVINISLMVGLYVYYMKVFTGRWSWWDVLLPLQVLLFIYVMGRSGYVVWKRKGIDWRGTFYSVPNIKRQVRK